VQRGFERFLFNPGMRTLLRLGVAPRAFALLETTGRKSGLRRQTPVGGAFVGPDYWVVAEHGLRCAYLLNLVAEPAVRIKVRRTWHRGRATVVPEDDAWARRRALARATGVIGRADGVFFRLAASTPLSVRIALDPEGA
jgi:deazaflavin-dependent oxidoreductase (nitroreductase family)